MVSVKVHVTVEPAVKLIVAVCPETEAPGLHVKLVKSHGREGPGSVTLYEPRARLPKVRLPEPPNVVIEKRLVKPPVAVKLNLASPPTAVLLMIMVPDLVSAYVQVTV